MGTSLKSKAWHLVISSAGFEGGFSQEPTDSERTLWGYRTSK